MATATAAQLHCWLCNLSFDTERKYLRHLSTKRHQDMEEMHCFVDDIDSTYPVGTDMEAAADDSQVPDNTLYLLDGFEGARNCNDTI